MAEEDFSTEGSEDFAPDEWNGSGGQFNAGRARRAAWTSDEEKRLAELAGRYSSAGQR